MNKISLILLCSLLFACAQPQQSADNTSGYSQQVDSVLNLMTLEEKVGQMIQYSNNKLHTGPNISNQNHIEEIKAGRVGSMFNIITTERARQYQELAMQSRLGIPLIFGLDVVHGMRTMFPIPLATAGSFDMNLIERTAQVAAAETSSYGVHWTFAPVVDVSREARWGRSMEGSGEDPWLACQIARAQVAGFQGKDYEDAQTIMACAKHFAAYGAAVAGKDYAEADMSLHTLHQVYLPPFKAAVDANVATFMNGFHDLNGVPVTASEYLQRDILKGEWNFQGFVVSDWGSVAEIRKHGMATDNKEAAKFAVIAGCDMDMHSMSYFKHLQDLVKEGAIDEKLIDDAVRRILQKKFELGLFDDPYRYNNRAEEINDETIIKANRALAREAGQKSIVLLKNENTTLPIADKKQKIALVGALNTSNADMLGNWKAIADAKEAVNVLEGLKANYPNSTIRYFEGYDLETNQLKAIPSLQQYDVVIVAVGERAMESGEAKSKADIRINANHQQLVKNIKEKYNKPTVALVMGGRPLIFSDMEPYADAILFTWWLGSEAGNSIADVLQGKYNPSAKLPMTFPRSVGQCPIYYNQKNTGRPWNPKDAYVSGYIDETVLPAYPFGYGLSYTNFEISKPKLSKDSYTFDETIELTVEVKNTGNYAGKETIQLYLRDLASSLTRPTKELCAYEQVELEKGETKQVTFKLTATDLGFFGAENKYITEAGDFLLMVGNNSASLQETKFTLNQ